MIKRILKKLINLVRPPVQAINVRTLTRDGIANKYLDGDGIEIGALHNPLHLPPSARVRYLDRMPADALRKQYPELNKYALVPVDIIDDGEELKTVSDSSLDFVIANHFIEHCQNPIKAVANMFRVLRQDGILYLSIPDKRFIFDRDRPVTSLEHIKKDFEQGPQWSRRPAFEEYVRLVDKITDEVQAGERVLHYMNMDYSIHFHVWTEVEMLELLFFLKQTLNLPLRFELMCRNDFEVIVIVKKLAQNGC